MKSFRASGHCFEPTPLGEKFTKTPQEPVYNFKIYPDTRKAGKPKPQHWKPKPKSQTLNPETLNPETLNPETLNPENLNPEP